MADSIHFDRDKALDSFLHLFWSKGYRYTTTKELARSAGISEGSLFNSFNSKRELYILSLRRYREKTRHMLEQMESNPSALEGLRQYWNAVGSMATDASKTRGCMITNASIEISDDPEISSYMKSVHLAYDKEFKRTLDRAVRQGELKKDTDTAALAQYLSHSAQGLRVLARFNPSRKKVENILRLTMATFDQYRA